MPLGGIPCFLSLVTGMHFVRAGSHVSILSTAESAEHVPEVRTQHLLSGIHFSLRRVL